MRNTEQKCNGKMGKFMKRQVTIQKRKWSNPDTNKKTFKCRVKENYWDTIFSIWEWQKFKSDNMFCWNAMEKQYSYTLLVGRQSVTTFLVRNLKTTHTLAIRPSNPISRRCTLKIELYKRMYVIAGLQTGSHTWG